MRDDDPLRPFMHGDEFALALAVSPLALQLAGMPGAGPSSLLIIPGLAAFQLACVLGDRIRIGALDAPNLHAVPSPAWSLLAGAYLQRRAGGLRRSDDLVWTWIMAMIVSMGVLALSAALQPLAGSGNGPSHARSWKVEARGPAPPRLGRSDAARHAAAGR